MAASPQFRQNVAMAMLLAAAAGRLAARGGCTASRSGTASRGAAALLAARTAACQTSLQLRQQAAMALRGALATTAASGRAQAAGRRAPRPEHKAPEHKLTGPHSKPGRSSSSHSKDGSSRPSEHAAAPRGKDGSSSVHSRSQPTRSTWEPRSKPEPERHGRKPPGAAALFAAGMAAAASLQPLKKARTAALRAQQPHAGSQHAGAAQQAGAGAHGAQAAGAVQQPGPQSPARETEVVAITLKATRATANKRKRRFMGDTPCDKRPNGKFTQTSVNRGLGSDLAMLSTKKRAAT